MINYIGIDSVEINRFINWYAYEHKTLSRIFSDEEIKYCLQNKNLSAQRFAVRFAAREALFKALCQYDQGNTIPLLTLCKATKIIQPKKAPELFVDWSILQPYCIKKLQSLQPLLSMTHTNTTATSIVLLQKMI